MVIISRRLAGLMPPLLDVLATVVPRSDSGRRRGAQNYTEYDFFTRQEYPYICAVATKKRCDTF